jgi:DNA-binding CsgD family transcriptional regulator
MRAHERLAELLTDPTEGARHLARSSDRPDAAAAQIVEDAATVAGARGAIVEAAELADQALCLTPVDAVDDRDRRTVVAARAHLRNVDTNRAHALATDLLHRATDGGRAAALVLLSDVEDARGDPERAIELRKEALAAADGLPSLRVETHLWLAHVLPFTDSVAAGDRHAVTALELAEALDDDALRIAALGTLAWGRYRAGLPGALELVDRALDLVHPGLDASLRRDLALGAVNSLVWSHELDRARSLVEAVDAEWSERDELRSADVQWCLGKIAFHAGRFDEAADHAARAREIRQQYMPDERELAGPVWLVALIAVHRGELDRARELVELNRPAAQRSIDRSGDDGVLGLVELWSGKPGTAVELFEAADVERRTNGVDEPSMFWWRGDYVEALLALGRVDEAEIVLDAWEVKAAELGRNAVLAHAARCRGLVAAARADVDGSLAQLERAGALHEAAGDPFGRARAMLALGTVRRRARRRTAAREALTVALAGFAACGAASWAAKARAELGSIGGRTRVEGLTPAEGRIATLVSEGRTNREVAATLFLTERTVATALTRIYGKLGVRSRTELALALSRTRQEDERAKT